MNLKKVFIEQFIFRIGDLLLGTCVYKQLQIQRGYNKLSAEQLNSLQLEKLNTLLVHAAATCSFYSQYHGSEGNPQTWLKQFPVLTKQNTIDFEDGLCSKAFNRKKLIKYETSGSSGVRAAIYVDKKEQSIFRAILLNWWEWTGFYFGKPMLQTGMSVRRGFVKGFKDKLFSTHYFDAFNLDESSTVERLRKLETIKNLHFGGYASSLYVIAQIAKKHNLNLHFDSTISWGDKMFDHYKTCIEDTFKTKVYENYSCNEGIMIGQKVDLPYFYIYTPNVFVELLDEKGNEVPDGEMGRVVVTKLDGYAMPLIRYDTGDLAINLPKEKYPETRRLNFPLLEKVIGRNTDIIKTPEGNSMIVHTFTGIFEFYPGIQQFQIVQNNMEEIDIRYIPSATYEDSILVDLEKQIRLKTKSSISIHWIQVDEILASQSGKPQIIINNLIKNSLADSR